MLCLKRALNFHFMTITKCRQGYSGAAIRSCKRKAASEAPTGLKGVSPAKDWSDRTKEASLRVTGVSSLNEVIFISHRSVRNEVIRCGRAYFTITIPMPPFGTEV